MDLHWSLDYIPDTEILEENIFGILKMVDNLDNMTLDSFDKLWFTDEEWVVILDNEVMGRHYI